MQPYGKIFPLLFKTEINELTLFHSMLKNLPIA